MLELLDKLIAELDARNYLSDEDTDVVRHAALAVHCVSMWPVQLFRAWLSRCPEAQEILAGLMEWKS